MHEFYFDRFVMDELLGKIEGEGADERGDEFVINEGKWSSDKVFFRLDSKNEKT